MNKLDYERYYENEPEAEGLEAYIKEEEEKIFLKWRCEKTKKEEKNEKM